ncbi:OmpA family protein [Longitalea luteola]|uniref:OmpA family protein n=1 Tax=Longitalea luteola TaxID=2812563 RepID=UPI001A95B8BC|nr:OmpA family protein [Longitalea luteola]
MASKKYVSFLSLLFLLTSAVSYAQLGGTYDVMDSSVVPSKRLPQHTEFMANNYAYPAKPRNQWELGLQVGAFSISGDVRNRFPGLGAAIHARKALGYVFSLRGQLGFGTTKGLNFQPSTSYSKNPAWAGYGAGTPVFYNYKTNIYDLSIQGVVTLSNIRFHKAKSSFNIYAFAGLGGMIYDVNIDALNGSTPYDFSSVVAQYGPSGFQYEDRKDIKSDLKDILDGDYETEGEIDNGQPQLFDKPFRFMGNVGVGVQFKLNKRLSLAIEDKWTITKSDLLDGNQWQENGPGQQTAQTRDYDAYNFLSLGINVAIGNKAVEPLWWLNPLDYAYNEVNKPRHMKLPKPVLDDADGDGITDQFDQEPNTPAGAPVDSHGVSRDTDGDGVPDHKDKELVTPTQCQPVDADGVGKCPPPACCDSLMKIIEEGGIRGKCGIGDLPSITFRPRSITLSNDAKALLASAAQQIKNNPNCKIAVIGYCSSSKSEQQLSWDRVNAVISYLVDKEGINQDRFIFKYGEVGGDCNTVDLRDGTGEEGPTTVPAPHPNLRRGR